MLGKGVFAIRMLAGEAGEFEAEMTQMKWEDGNIIVMAKGGALWSPLPMMGVWDMKLTIPREEFPRVLKLLFSFVLRDGYKMIWGVFSHKNKAKSK